MTSSYEPPLFLFDGEPDATSNSNGAGASDIPSETQLTLLCLDYLRDLRRAYSAKELWEAEGLDADYLSLAVWALSRVFVRPKKLNFEKSKICTLKEEEKSEEALVLCSGGLGDEQSVGNDAWYRQLSWDESAASTESLYRDSWNTRQEIKNIRDEINQGFYLTGNIVIPTMDEITSEILLRLPNKGNAQKQAASSYEYNDAHSSNAHRFYMLNGLASGGGGSANDEKIAALTTPSNARQRSPRNNIVQPSLAWHGGPLTFGEIASAGLSALGARARIEAEREMVLHNPLFEQFVRAVSSKGFFSDKKKEEKSSGSAGSSGGGHSKKNDAAVELSLEEEKKRARLIYEEKYRKVVNKFRSKLAAKAEVTWFQQQSQHQTVPQSHQAYSTGYAPQSPSIMHSSPNMHYHSPSKHASDSSTVADRQRRRREGRIERARTGRSDGYALNQEKSRMVQHQQMQERMTSNIQQQQQMQMQQPMQRQHQEERMETGQYQPVHNAQPQWQSPQRPPTPQQQLQQPIHHYQLQQQQQQQQLKQKSQQQPKQAARAQLGQWLDSTKSSPSSTQFNFEQHQSPFGQRQTPPRPTRTQSPPIQQHYVTPKSTTVRFPTHSREQDNQHDMEPDKNVDEEEELLNQHEAEHLNAEGNQLMQQKQFQLALESYTAAVELSPSGPNSHIYYSNRSAAYLSLNNHVESIHDSKRSLELCPEYAKAHSRLGLAYFVSGRYEEAVEAYEVALEYEPENEWNRSHYEKALKKLGGKQKSKSGEETPFDEEMVHRNNARSYHGEEDYGGSATHPSEFVQTHQADQYKDAGNAYMSNKEYEKAVEQYSHAIAVSPSGSNSHVYYSNRAAAYCYLGQYDAAADDCMMSIELNPMYEKAHARLGLSRFFLEDYHGAIEAYEHALQLEPSNAASKSYLGKAKKRLAEQMEREKDSNGRDFMDQHEELQRTMQEQMMLRQQEYDQGWN
ncbi:hypothetical protein HJC23_011697 [Cyclotella cryptica]|uniref:Uncharacterized protein n=1 Tax=Cyclotella cryptica TaxID=29204 RepID=A0ABD3QRC3_9STRA|eukprot:CCRYP_004811-RA/>CCRYP_004811-RA protein AED:0.03 eAED:0.03 QI:196/1/1/1/1/1/2/264/962